MKRYKISTEEEEKIRKELERRTDPEASRLKKLLALPDLTNKENSPVKILCDQILNLPRFKDFDIIKLPRIVTTEDNFDLLNTPEDHPSRKETDTYYFDNNHILRTQMTVMWPYYFRNEEVLERLKTDGEIGSLSPGIVFRKDEIDRKHFPAFHQVDFLYVCKRDKKIITLEELQDVQTDAVKAIFGNIEFRFLVDTFPFTDPSIQVEINWEGNWIEITGAGLVHPNCLRNFGLDPEIYNGWAGTFGLDRVAMIKMGIPDIRILWSNDPRIKSQFKDINSKFKEVSKYPPVVRDISFVVENSFVPNNYFDLVRDIAGDLVEQVELLDKYEDAEKFGKSKVSYAYRVTYRSLNQTLTNTEVDKLHKSLEETTRRTYSAIIR